jgi:flagellar basal-body rod protein FlgF
MDRLIYTAMTGARHLFDRQAAVANNLANASSPGYRAQDIRARAVAVAGEGMPTRSLAVGVSVADDFSPGPMTFTGRALDIAIQGGGWLAVQGADGREAYTRAGGLQVNANGLMQTQSGLNVVGDGGPLSIPPDSKVTIAPDGTVSVVQESGAQNTVNVVGRLKLVSPAESSLQRGGDGLFRMRDGSSAPQDDSVRLATESIEGSNVNMVEAMVGMIGLARQFEMQIKMLQSADTNARQASQLFAMSR